MGKATTLSCQNTRELVLSAINKLMTNTGWTSRTIIRFIMTDYSLSDPKIGRKIARALKYGAKFGHLQVVRGRYRLKPANLSRGSVHWLNKRQKPKRK